jgi:hypothetical protein
MTEEQRDQIETATVTVGRAKRFYSVLCDLDFDEAYEQAQAERDAEVTGEPTGIAEQAAHDEGDSTATVRLNMEGLTETLMTEGKLEEMAEVVLDIPETVDVDDVPVLMIVEGLADFIPAYGRLFGALVGTSSATVSTLNGTD